MIVTVTYPLNKRKDKPATLPGNKIGALKIGDTIDVESTEKGQFIEGNNIWLKDTGGFYYWSGATNYKELFRDAGTPPASSTLPVNDFYAHVSELFNSIDTLKPFADSKGEDVVIAVLDSGINPHDGLKAALLPAAINCVTGETGTNDIGGHGTQVAGIIAANGDTLTGIAPGAKLVNIRVLDKGNGSSRKDLKQGLIEVLGMVQRQERVDIVNMSLYVGYKNENPVQKAEIEEIEQLIRQLADNGVILVAAAGDDADVLPSVANPKFPSKSVNCISAATLAKDNTAQPVSRAINCVFINNPVNSTTNNNQYRDFDFSSAYTAIVSAFCAKILSRTKASRNDIVALLSPLSASTTNTVFKPYKS